MSEADYRNLADQIMSARSELEQLPPDAVGAHYYFHLMLQPGRTGPRQPLHDLLAQSHLLIVGSRGTGEPSGPVSLILSGSMGALERLLLIALNADHLSKKARSGLDQIAAVAAPRSADVLRFTEPDTGTWDTTLHPLMRDDRGNAIPINDATFAKWCAWVERLGGEVPQDYRRPVGGLTFVPLRLPADKASEAARFNPLRAMRPMAKVGLRSSEQAAVGT